jgi:glycosyltransferase involved in cell wall biosynthesis/peptidoglycan/xylan/chitin deacetylase (PgdA/CDA1 family)
MRPEQSILIITKDRQELFPQTVASVLAAVPEGAAVEIVVVDETDRPLDHRFPETVRYIPIPVRHRGFGYARNLACRAARGDLVAFLDDDVLPAPGWLDEIFKPLADRQVGAVGGPVLPQLDGLNTVGCALSLLGFPAGGLERLLRAGGECLPTPYISTGNCAFRAEAGRMAGGFDELLRFGGEDQEFFARVAARFKTVYAPRAVVYHRQRRSWSSIWSWFVRRGQAEFFRRCKTSGPLSAWVLPLRANFNLKALAVTGLVCSAAAISGAALGGVISAVALAGIGWTLARQIGWGRLLAAQGASGEYAAFARRIMQPAAWPLLLPLKLFMDLGFEFGRARGLVRFWRHRHFHKPVVLALHHLGEPSPGAGPAEARYYFPVGSLERLVDDCIRDGRIFVPVSEIMRRIRDCPNSLYFEKLVAVTFDDAYRSIRDPLAALLAREALRPAIFVPAALAGRSNLWDAPRGWAAAGVMDWQELQGLAALGAEIGAHGMNHLSLAALDPQNAAQEIAASRAALASMISGAPGDRIPFSYPYGGLHPEVRRLVEGCGFIGAVANHGGNIRPGTDRFEMPRFSLGPADRWENVARISRGQWAKDLLRDCRDGLTAAVARLAAGR